MSAELAMAPGRSLSREDALVERLCAGDTDAVGEVYDLHHAAVRAFARRLVGDDATAEDLVHDVFVALPQAIRGFQGGSSIRTFVIALAINHARHHLRAASRRRAAMERFGREPRTGPLTPERAADQASLAFALAAALDELPLEQRVAFVLCAVEDRSAREAAEIVSAPEATVRTRLFHARQKLRASLARRGFS